MKSTAAQRAFIEALARGAGEQFKTFFDAAAAVNTNAPLSADETPTQAARRLTKTAASKLIDSMLEAGIKPQRKPIVRPETFVETSEPKPLTGEPDAYAD